MPLQALASGLGAERSARMFMWGICGALLWSGASVRRSGG
jgi:hypothetical protein